MSRSNWSARAARALSGHLDRLRDTLGTLGERLRQAITLAVGGTVAGAVQDAVRLLLEAPEAPPWERPAYRSWRDPEEEDETWYDPPDERGAEAPQSVVGDERPAAPADRRARWGQALAVGCQAIARWLRRQSGRLAGLQALGLGVVSALTAYLAGPVFVAGVCLAHSALSLQDLSASRSPPESGPAREPWNHNWR
jgi:hypothetical protein